MFDLGFKMKRMFSFVSQEQIYVSCMHEEEIFIIHVTLKILLMIHLKLLW